MATRASYMIQHVISRESSRDMTSPPINTKPQGVNLEAAVTEDGHAPLFVFPHKIQLPTFTVSQPTKFTILRPAILSCASCMIYHVIRFPTNRSSTYSGQSQHSLSRPITDGVSSDVTPPHATRRFSSSTVVTTEELTTLFIFTSKKHVKYNYQHARCHRPQNYTFFKFWGLCPILGPTTPLF
jgi:hypothetical protein